ncbi:hypothetical protein ACQCU1_18910 [Sutcliffiella horikoshii]|uniref:hypothetical protein n=1 Tax=Sutcliffiella horikoshii TaxID=79883 RepID=UPI003CF363D3
MDLFKQLREIEEHFNNISKEELHQNLIESGLGEIEPVAYSEMKLISNAELQKYINKNNFIYAKKSYNYRYINKSLTVYKNEIVDQSPVVQAEVVA